MWLPTGMLIGGALGNIIDRIRDGSVTDFIKLPLGWPPFNLADASITLGILHAVLADRQLTPHTAVSAPSASRSRSRTSTCSSSTRAPGSSCTPRAGTARTRSRSCSRR